ncbi:MAG TPA: BlaI/MecI/CopY family transcriptional regulator [bacterium]|nr:BlaI/MecI/CopY family transcriptional regulator [bacterium]
MARHTTSTLTEVELEFMQILWSEDEASPEDIQKTLLQKERTLTGGSIRKMLSILMKKGYVKRVKQGKKHVYSVKVQQDQANRSMIRELMNRAFGGSASLMVAALMDSHAVPDKDIEKIEQLISERKKEARK